VTSESDRDEFWQNKPDPSVTRREGDFSRTKPITLHAAANSVLAKQSQIE
jgi:hypothetical protein